MEGSERCSDWPRTVTADRSILREAHAQLQRAVFEAFPDDLELIVRDVYELVDTHLDSAAFTPLRHELEVEAMVESEMDRRVA